MADRDVVLSSEEGRAGIGCGGIGAQEEEPKEKTVYIRTYTTSDRSKELAVGGREANEAGETEEEAGEDGEEDVFPGDRGALSAYLVLLGSFFVLFPAFGFMVSLGSLQDYLLHNQLSKYSAQEVGWIPSVFTYLGLALGILFGPILDRHRPVWMLLSGSVGFIAMMLLLAECRLYWQFLLCLGGLGGISAAVLTTTALQVLSHWFKTRKGLASGVAMVGNSFGGVVIPLILQRCLPRYGYAWSIRILALVFLVCLVGGNLLIRQRLKPSPEAKKAKVFSLELYGQPSFAFLCASIFGIEITLFGALGILPTYVSLGTDFPASTAFYVISVLNASSCFGRIIPGYLSDKFGRFNVLGISLVLTLVFMLTIWLPFGRTSVAALYAFVILFGFGTGCWMAMVPACVGQLSGPHHFGRYFGTCYFVASLATLITVPISGQLIENVGPEPLIGFMSAVLTLSIGAFVLCRWACLGWRWSWTQII